MYLTPFIKELLVAADHRSYTAIDWKLESIKQMNLTDEERASLDSILKTPNNLDLLLAQIYGVIGRFFRDKAETLVTFQVEKYKAKNI